MEIILSCFVFLFGILTWVPFLNNVYGHDQAATAYCVAGSKKGDIVFYKDLFLAAIGHYTHFMLIQSIWKKDNTKAFYWFMCLYNSISVLVLFWLLSYLFGLLPAVLGSMFFSLYIASPRLDGNWGPFEQLLPLPLFGSILCILISSNNPYPLILMGGLLLGYAILVKQVAVLYLPGFFIMVAGTGHSFYHQLTFLGGIIITNLIPLFYYWLRHNAFWEYLISTWLVQLPSAINPQKYNKLYPRLFVRGQKNPQVKKQVLINTSRSLLPVLFLSVIGVLILFSYHFSFLFLGLFICLLTSASMIFMRGTFFPHYWLNMVPWLAIFAGFGLSEFMKSSVLPWTPSAAAFAGILAVILLFIDAVRVDRKYYVFSKDPYQFLIKVWGEALANRYKLLTKIGEYIKNTTKMEDRILICGWAPHILLYSDRTHFTKEPCLYTEDYLDIYSRDNPSCIGFLNSIFKLKNFKIIKQRENVFHKGYPEIILFEGGKIDVEGFEKLTGIKYSLDENAKGYPLFRADLDLTELMYFYESPVHKHPDKKNGIALYKKELIETINRKGWKDSSNLLKELMKAEPSDLDCLLLIGDCLINTGNYRLLLNFYKRLIEKHLVPDEAKHHLMNKIGESYFYQNKYSEAEEVFKKVLHFNPSDTTALNNLGVVCFNQNRTKNAGDYFQKVLEIDPNNEHALANMSTLR